MSAKPTILVRELPPSLKRFVEEHLPYYFGTSRFCVVSASLIRKATLTGRFRLIIAGEDIYIDKEVMKLLEEFKADAEIWDVKPSALRAVFFPRIDISAEIEFEIAGTLLFELWELKIRHEDGYEQTFRALLIH